MEIRPPQPVEEMERKAAQLSEEERIRQEFERANEHRDYSIYIRSMDAALEAKARSLFPHFQVEEGDIMVDAGSGTGALAELAAREFRGARVYALDISHELQERAQEGKALTELVYGDAGEQNFPTNFVQVKYYATSGHEIESFGGPGRMRHALEHTFLELKPGGQVIIRDFAKPSRTEPIFMKIISRVGIDQVPPGIKTEDIDYNTLSTSALLDRFQKEFRGGGVFSFERVTIDGEEYIKIDPEWAHEFYLRKDYTANWRQEIKEKYTYWTPEEAKQILEDLGYENVRVIPDPNEWILKQRLEGKIKLYEMIPEGELQHLPFPMTHMVVIGEKPRSIKNGLGEGKKEIVRGVDYQKVLSSIEIDRENNKVRIGDHEFEVESTEPLVGTKKFVFRLHGGRPCVLKVVRPDTYNDHNVFKSMYQVIERQKILRHYKTPHLKIIEHDPEGPPFRYVVQEAVPENALSAVDLIQKDMLKEEDVKQMAKIINAYEKGKEWQLDTNPFSWFRLTRSDGSTQMVYISGKVYRYDEQWAFKRVGLLQWVDPQYIRQGRNFSAAIPSYKSFEIFQQKWREDGEHINWWGKYLDSVIRP